MVTVGFMLMLLSCTPFFLAYMGITSKLALVLLGIVMFLFAVILRETPFPYIRM